MSYDVIIRNGTIVDGTGAPGYLGDVAITGDRITGIGHDLAGIASNEVDAHGCIVSPGFIDIHTHVDAQIWWDPAVTPSAWHGFTTAVMGNCGVTFAPCNPGDQGYLATMMESVEDIPADAILHNLPWTWQTYGQLLSQLDGRPLGLNVGGLIGHCAVRYAAMGEDSLSDQPATPSQAARMREAIREALQAGALGFSTSRTALHTVPDGRPVPGTFAPVEELMDLVEVIAEVGHGAFTGVNRLPDEDGSTIPLAIDEVELFARIAQESGVPTTFNLVQGAVPGLERRVLEIVNERRRGGAPLRPQTTCRPIGVLYGLVHRTPFDRSGEWRALRELTLDAKLERLRDRSVSSALVAAAERQPPTMSYDRIFVFPEGAARYDLGPDDTLAAIARQRGIVPAAAFVELALETEGSQLLSWPIFNGDHSAVEAMVTDPSTMIGLGDAGAHVGQIMDASQSTHLLAYWVRDRGVLNLVEAVRLLTSDAADFFGIPDRGRLAIGSFADVNVFDLNALSLQLPRFVHDMPGGAGRFVQDADGYRWTFVNGTPIREEGRLTGALPGTVLRGR